MSHSFLLQHVATSLSKEVTPKLLRNSSVTSSCGSFRERDRDPNRSCAATALVSYDGRNLDADNMTTANDDRHSARDYDGEQGSYIDVTAEESTLNSELYPQQLKLLPHKQQSFDLRSVTEGTSLHRIYTPSSTTVVHSQDGPPPALPISPLHYIPQESSRYQQHEPQFENRYQSTPAYGHSHQLRQSYPPPLHNLHQHQYQHQHDVAPHSTQPYPHNGHVLVNAINRNGKGNAMALSLDSSLHCGLSTSYSTRSSVPNTLNSSMSSGDFDFSRNGNVCQSYSHTHSTMNSSERSSRTSTPSPSNTRKRHQRSDFRRDAGRRLWVPRSSSKGAPSNQEFCYCAPRGDVLIVSKAGDVIYLTYLKDKSNNLRPCRLSVRADNPLMLLLGKVTKDMCKEIRDIREASMQGSAFSVETENAGSECDDGYLEKDPLQRATSGGFIGKDSFPQITSGILSDTLWITSYHVTKLPSVLKKPYESVALMLEAVKCKLPKLILYLTEKKESEHRMSPQSSLNLAEPSEQTAVCKCMIMCNDPLPDFSVRWVDGTKLKYCLRDGNLRITNNSGSSENHYRWEGCASTDADWTTSAPKAIRKYLLLAQSAMRQCIAEDIKHQQESEDASTNWRGCYGSDTDNSSHRLSSPKPTKSMKYPIVVVESISNT